MEYLKSFLIVDDDRQNNFLTEMALKKSFSDVKIATFMIPELALEYIENEFKHPLSQKTTIILDINMPSMTGWEFIEKFEKLDNAIKKNFEIYILSSSIDPIDRQLAEKNSFVSDFIEKPLSKVIVQKLFC